MSTVHSPLRQRPWLRTSAVLMGLVTALSACTQLGPNYVRPNVELPADYPEPQLAAAVDLVNVRTRVQNLGALTDCVERGLHGVGVVGEAGADDDVVDVLGNFRIRRDEISYG